MSQQNHNNTYNRGMWQILKSIAGWMTPLPTPPTQPIISIAEEEKVLTHNWEWLLSTTEEICNKQEQKQSDQLKKELNTLRQISSSVSYRKHFTTLVTHYYSTLDEMTLAHLVTSRLDASKRDRIIRDALRPSMADWYLDILSNLFLDPDTMLSADISSFSNRWHEVPYKKNICGELVSMGFHASHASQDKGLTITICSEILWSIHLSLSREITIDINRTMTKEESEFLCSLIAKILPRLVSLYYQTSNNVGTVAERAGKLPSKWKQEMAKEKQRLNEIKKEGTDAKWSIHSYDKESVQVSGFKERRDLIAKSLSFTSNISKCDMKGSK